MVLQGHLAVLLLDLLQRWAVEHSVHKSEATKTQLPKLFKTWALAKIPHLNGGGLTDLEEFVQIFTLHQGTQLQGALPRAILLLLVPRHGTGSSHP